ncbi:right-handed parallel beta-helix repeat-containing protein [Geoalkalibacter sp.]|uniref:right-handed parallel beta-helix repeat-containing protein n=1 Tax=Geoalkalibacter sp. TaxID=3041440 RepID=UPI00272E8C37|nr:right-handed parallel beta-helix repeat-containing protein [Geoalkalibacter sp.]
MRGLLLFLLLLLPVAAQARSIAADTLWQGRVELSGAVRVEKGVTLTVAPGSEVHFSGGGLEVLGTLAARGARFTGDDWEGIILRGGESLLEDCLVSGARTGIQVLGGKPLLRNLELSGNTTGLELRQQSSAEVVGCRILGNREVGLFLKDDAKPRVEDCIIADNGRFGVYIHRALPRVFRGNQLNGNAVGLMIAYYGSDPEISGNRFAGNEVAIKVDRAARPTLVGNQIADGGTGVLLARRSDARVRNNRINGNRIGVQVEYSSYPVIRDNDLSGNAMALVLDHQSSAWEKENGEAARAAESNGRGAFGQAARQPASEAARRPVALTGTVDAKHNWWGEAATQELTRGAGRGNPSFIHDGRDQPYFEDQGKQYPLDIVEFVPWRNAPLTPEPRKSESP